MPLTGKFEADFSSYVNEVKKATGAAKDFENANRNIEKSVDDLANASSKIAEAPVRNFQLIKGGADTAAEGASKVAKGLTEAGDAAGTAEKPLAQFGKTVSELGHALDLVGIDLGPTAVLRKGLVALDEILETTVTGMSGLGLAAAAVGTAMATFKMGRAIAETLQLDEKVESLVLHLKGLPTVAERAAEDTAKAIADARKKYPQIPIGSMSDVEGLRQAEAEEKIKANEIASAENDRANAMTKVWEAQQKLDLEIQRFDAGGYEDELIRAINSHKVSMEDLTNWYHLSSEAMQHYAEEAAHVAQVEANNAKKTSDLYGAGTKAKADDQQKLIDKEKERMKLVYEQIDLDTKAAEKNKEANYQELVAQAKATEAVKKHNIELATQVKTAEQLLQIAAVNAYDLSTPGGFKEFLKLNPTAMVSGKLTADWFKDAGHTLAEAIAEGLITFANPGTLASMYTLGGALSNSGYTAGGGLAPAPAAPAAPTNINTTVNVSGVFDPASSQTLGSVVGKAVAKTVTDARVWKK